MYVFFIFLGHLNMNQVKSFFQRLDKICLEPLGREVLNFKSNKAYDFFIHAKDNHKAWESFEIFLFGTALEIIHVYLKNTMNKPTALGFLKWQSQLKSATLKLMCQLIFTYGLGIYVQRVGDRNNDIKYSDAGRYSFFSWFYGFSHRIYRELEYRDLRNKVLYPEEVRAYRESNLTFATNSIDSRNQGGDFQLEQKIKRQKLLAPKGIVSKKTWQRISRSLDSVDLICKNTSSILGTSEEARSRTTILNDETLEWRAVLRKSGFLVDEQSKFVTNIYGEVLSEDLVDFSSKIEMKRKDYWDAAKDGTPLQNITYENLTIIQKIMEDEDDEDDEV